MLEVVCAFKQQTKTSKLYLKNFILLIIP